MQPYLNLETTDIKILHFSGHKHNSLGILLNRNPNPATAASGTGKPELKASRSIPPAGLHLLLENTVRISASFGALCRQAELQQSSHPLPPNWDTQPCAQYTPVPSRYPTACHRHCLLPALPSAAFSATARMQQCCGSSSSQLGFVFPQGFLLPLGQIIPEYCVSPTVHFSTKVGNIQVSNQTIALSLDPFCTTPPSMAS